MGGQITVESVVRCSWNGWPDDRGIRRLSVDKFKRKRLMGEIDLPVVRLGADSQKANLGIHLEDLAAYIDRQRAAAIKERDQLTGRRLA
jgi:hypothetical protein